MMRLSPLSHVTEIPHTFSSLITTTKCAIKYLKSKAINKAVAVIQRGDFFHYSDTAAEYKCNREALSWRIRGLTKSKKEADSFWRQCLTDEQKDVLIQRINDLTDQGMPPTSQIIKNLAEEIKGARIRKNWVG